MRGPVRLSFSSIGERKPVADLLLVERPPSETAIRTQAVRRLLLRHELPHLLPMTSCRTTRPPSGPGPADDLETKHETRQLDALLSVLNPDQRSAFVLLEVEGYSGKEIARLQGVPVNTVWARIYKARRTLQTGLAKANLTAAHERPNR